MKTYLRIRLAPRFIVVCALTFERPNLWLVLVRYDTSFFIIFCHKRGQYHYLHMYLSISVHTGSISVYIFKQVSISNLRNSGPRFDPRKGAILEQNYKGHFCPSGWVRMGPMTAQRWWVKALELIFLIHSTWPGWNDVGTVNTKV